MNRNKLVAILLLLILVWLSFYKDEITPDYRNTLNADFLNPTKKHVTDENHYMFWAIAVAYSLVFVFIPYLIIRFWFNNKTALLALGLLSAMMLVEYAFVFSGTTTLTVHILPKINRYFHSPIVTLFFIALFTLNNRNERSGNSTI